METDYKIEKTFNEDNKRIGGTVFWIYLSQITDYLFFSVYGILGIRLLLALFAGKSNSEFAQLIKFISEPLYSPFIGFFPYLTAELGLVLVLPLVIATYIYMFIYLGINGLLTTLINRNITS